MYFRVGSSARDTILGISIGLGDPLAAGEFSRALQSHLKQTAEPPIPELVRRIVLLLRLSRRFMRMINKLDGKYLAFDNTSRWPLEWRHDWGLRSDGVLTHGPYKGRRLLTFNHSFKGSSFTPAGDAEARNEADIIAFMDPVHAATSSLLERDRIGHWIEFIAHETVHAFHHVTRSGPRPTELAARVRASVEEELATRKEEIAILAEIRRAHRFLSKFVSSPRSMSIRGIERDFFPSILRRTYLEHFVFTEHLQEAIAKEVKLDRARVDAEVDAIPLEKRPLGDYLGDRPLRFFDPKLRKLRTFGSDYARLRFILRIIDARWRWFEKRPLTPGTMEYGKEKERVLRSHWRAFFGGKVGYTL